MGNKARKLLEKFGENSEQNSGGNSGQKFGKFGELSFCQFSDPTFSPKKSTASGLERQLPNGTYPDPPILAFFALSLFLSFSLLLSFLCFGFLFQEF